MDRRWENEVLRARVEYDRESNWHVGSISPYGFIKGCRIHRLSFLLTTTSFKSVKRLPSATLNFPAVGVATY